MKKLYGRLMLIVLLSVMLFFCALTVQAKEASIPLYAGDKNSQQEVRGVVSDQAGIPLPGVTVAVKGKNRGTTTDNDGEYSITISPEDILVFSFVGFQSFEEPVDGRREINVRLKEEIGSLDEVQINAGYYNTTKRESTGNISRVTGEEIELQPVISPLQALQGRMAGVEIIPGGDQPGTASSIRIRGRNSLREDGNFPLYIIDGVPIISNPIDSNTLLAFTGIDPLNNIDLSNIESIEVLKDADATAIYGSRGANGVVLITTKKGIHRKTGLEARVYTGGATVPNRLDLLNTEQYLQIRRRAFENDEVMPTETNAYDLTVWDQNRYTDWQDLFFGGTSSITNANIVASGGNQNTSFRLSGSFYNQGTVYPADRNYNKITGGLNLNHSSNDNRLLMDFSINYGLDNNKLVGNGSFNSSIFMLPPNAPPLFEDDGSLHWEQWSAIGHNNPMAGFFDNSITQSNNLISNFGFTYLLFPGLSLKSNMGYNNFSSQEIVKRPRRSYNPANWENINHTSSHLQAERKSWIVEPQINYETHLGKVNINSLVGITFQESEYTRTGFQGQGYVAESLIGNIGAAQSITNANDLNTQYRYTAIFGRFGLNWDKKYFLNLTGRRDGSSRFGPGKRFVNFGAVGSAWIFSEEAFIKEKISFLSFGKLRGSYGTTGNDQIGDYGYLDTYEVTRGPGGLYPTQLSNPDYSWEVNKKLEAAIELGFFQDKINFGLSWYQNQSSSQLVGYPLPAITGFTTVQANLPATVRNTGWEIELSTSNINSNNFRWETSLNISLPDNKLVSYPNIEQSSYANTYRVGHPLNISLLYQYEGIDPDTGFYTVTDVNQDGRFDYEDRVIIRNLGRQIFGGISNNLNFNNFSLQFLWEFVKHEGTLSMFNAGELGMQRVDVMNAFDSESRYQNISASSQASIAYSRVLNSNFPIENASFLRLKTLSFGYSFPSSTIGGLGLNNARIFMNGQNLITLTPYKGMDPEMPSGGTQFGALRTITGGIQLNF